MTYPQFFGPDNVPSAVRTLVEQLLPALVEGDHPALLALQLQVPLLRIVRVELTGAGFFADFDITGEVPLADPPCFAGGDAVIRLAGATAQAGCVLFVRDGRITTLEGYTHGDDAWTEDTEVVSVADVVPVHPG